MGLTHCGLEMPYDVNTWSTFTRVMAWCLTAPSRITITEVSWHSRQGNFTGNVPDIYAWYELEKNNSKL